MLSKKLKKQIESEGSERSEGFESILLATVAKTEYEIGAEKYAEKWQAAEARAERYYKALKEILCMTPTVTGANNMRYIARQAITPKTSTDE